MHKAPGGHPSRGFGVWVEAWRPRPLGSTGQSSRSTGIARKARLGEPYGEVVVVVVEVGVVVVTMVVVTTVVVVTIVVVVVVEPGTGQVPSAVGFFALNCLSLLFLIWLVGPKSTE